MLLEFLFFLFLSLSPTKSDLPVHCLKSQILGEWTLETSSHIDTSDGRVLCGHDSPDKASTSYKAFLDAFKAKSSFKVDLKEDDTVIAIDDKNEKGSWSMIYDEGFEIKLKGVKYFAFSAYEIKNSTAANNAVSICDKTLVGWYYVGETKEKGCYRGVKTEANKENVSFQQTWPKGNEHHSKLKFHGSIKKTHQQILNILKNTEKSWEAGLDPMFEKMTFIEMNRFAGRSKVSSNRDNKDKDYKHFSRENVDDLPKDFNCKSLLQESRRQSSCGSCYIFSTMEMAQARLKKKFNETVQLSIQYSINCNYYNQGCEGGYPTLVTKFGLEFQFVEEECLKYTGRDGKCSDACDINQLDKHYKVSNYYFLGGAYGKSTERLMMLELMNKGPFVVSFEPNMDFMFYRKGIYHSVLAADWILNGQKQPDWEKVDHSVLLAGWGEENGEKYWLLQNSWGASWGEGGYFRMRRGTDESGIESMGEAADFEIVENKKKKDVSVFKRKKQRLTV